LGTSAAPGTLNDRDRDAGTAFANTRLTLERSASMGREDIAAGKVKQVKGKANDIAGAVRGDPGQQLKGKVQKAIGKVQEAVGKASAKD
jgi:uncharacterized protein YjbJ (UPF0337 family)